LLGNEFHRRAARYEEKILHGTNPQDLPVEQPTKFDLIINGKTATALGLTIPPQPLVSADRVIESEPMATTAPLDRFGRRVEYRMADRCDALFCHRTRRCRARLARCARRCGLAYSLRLGVRIPRVLGDPPGGAGLWFMKTQQRCYLSTREPSGRFCPISHTQSFSRVFMHVADCSVFSLARLK